MFASGGAAQIHDAGIASGGSCASWTVNGGTVSANHSDIPGFTMSSGSFTDFGLNFKAGVNAPPATPFVSWTTGSLSITGGNLIGSGSVTGVPITSAKLVLSAGWGTTASWTTGPIGYTKRIQGTVTASGTGQAANPTITYTFPTPFATTNIICKVSQIGGTQAAVANPFTVGAPSVTSVVFTYTGTPSAGNTLQLIIECDTLQ